MGWLYLIIQSFTPLLGLINFLNTLNFFLFLVSVLALFGILSKVYSSFDSYYWQDFNDEKRWYLIAFNWLVLKHRYLFDIIVLSLYLIVTYNILWQGEMVSVCSANSKVYHSGDCQAYYNCDNPKDVYLWEANLMKLSKCRYCIGYGY